MCLRIQVKVDSGSALVRAEGMAAGVGGKGTSRHPSAGRV